MGQLPNRAHLQELVFSLNLSSPEPFTSKYFCRLFSQKGLIILLGWLQKRAILEMFTIGVRLEMEN